MSALRDVKRLRYLPPQRAARFATGLGVAGAALAMTVVLCTVIGYGLGARDQLAQELAHRLAAADACRDDELPALLLHAPHARERDGVQCLGAPGSFRR